MDSYWIESTKNQGQFDKLQEDVKNADVCIIGAGIFGLTTGYYLAKNGKKVVILERENEIGLKTSGNTTAKITSQHGLIYKYLIDNFGKEFARKYLWSNEKAIKNIMKIIEEENIECDFVLQDNYMYTTDELEVQKIKDEEKAVNSLDIIKAEYTKNIELPFEVLAALKFPNQAQFHPRKYMLGLAKAIEKYGGKIYTDTVVTDVQKDGDGYVTTANGKGVLSKYAVLATRYPILIVPGFYFIKMYQETSYAIGVDTKTNLFNGMYRDTDSQKFSFRTAKYNGKDILILGGLTHKTGEERDLTYTYNILENKAKQYYPQCEILFRWNTEDCISLDKVPYIGKYSSMMENCFVATGFKKWGMTMSNVAANIIVDNIFNRENEYAEIYDSTRVKPIKNRWEMKNMITESVDGIILKKFKVKNKSIDDIKEDSGKVLEIDGTNVGIYKDSTGEIFAVKPYCTHLGCLLTWNDLDKTWDCPCHGSRFNFLGENIYDPAIRSLEKYMIEL